MPDAPKTDAELRTIYNDAWNAQPYDPGMPDSQMRECERAALRAVYEAGRADWAVEQPACNVSWGPTIAELTGDDIDPSYRQHLCDLSPGHTGSHECGGCTATEPAP